ncbi:MAG TPA: VOC family protein [Cytophagaceae bacterium]|nr:VOC family protein [Cytophagaceae bacterium]
MISINPYLNFPGNAEEAINFYKSVFGGELAMLQRYKETGMNELSPADGEKLMHAALPLGQKGGVIMVSDILESKGDKFVLGDNFSLSITTESEAEADTIFAKLSAGGKTTLALEKTFWGSYFGMCTDKFGIQWMVSYEYKK